MKQFLLALFILSAGFMKSQCSITASVTQPSCPGNCDASVTLSLSSGCTAFPYILTINGGSCTPTGSFVMSSASITFSNLCACGSPFSAVLSTTSFPVAFTNFAIVSGPPVTTFAASSVQASCSSCCDGTINTVTGGGTGPYTYTWTPGSSTTGTLTNACPGSYTLCVKDSKGCSACSVYSLGFSTGIIENEATPVKLSYSKEEIIITDIMPINTLNVYDLTGRLVYKSENAGQKEIRLNKSQFNKGIYVISIEGNRRLSKHKIIVD